MKWNFITQSLSTEDIQQVESYFDINLPEDYVQQIGSINGGVLFNAYIEHPRLLKIPYSRNVPLDHDSIANIYDMYPLIGDSYIFPFGEVGDGSYFCFDLQKNAVVLYIPDIDDCIDICNCYSDLMSLIKFH